MYENKRYYVIIITEILETGGYMSKIRIKAEIINNGDINSYETQAIIQDDILKYTEDKFTKVIYNLEDHTLLRENEKIKMFYSFKTNKGLIEIKELGKVIDIDIKVHDIKRNKNNIKVHYEIDKDEFIYRVGEIK